MPVVLEGGLKAVIDCYPTKVHNPNLFVVVTDTNNEIDELLDLESISYPEPGSALVTNQKVDSTPIVDNLQDYDFASVKNDQIPKTTTKHILDYVEGERTSILNRARESKDNIAPEEQNIDIEDDMLDQDKLRNLVEEERAMILDQARASKAKVLTPESHDADEDNEKFRGIVEEERSLILNQARAVKPKDNGVVRPPMIDYRSKPSVQKPQVNQMVN